jgi:hypothetical protein
MVHQISLGSPARYTLIRGCSLFNDRRLPSRYYIGTSRRVAAVTSAYQRTALSQLALGVDPLIHVSSEVRVELERFIEGLALNGFLNRQRAQLSAPKRYFESISESDIAANHLRSRSEPELAQSEWIDGSGDGGSSIVAARSQYPIVLSGRSRVITLLYSILLASGVTRVRFADRHYRSNVESTDVGFGAISGDDLGLNFYERCESARRSLSLFPIEPSSRYDLDTSRPVAIVHYGDCDPESLVEWSNKRLPHLVIHKAIGDEIAVGPMVISGETPCIRCLSLYEIDNFGFTRLERIPINEVGELPTYAAHYIASIVAMHILNFIDRGNERDYGGATRNTGIGEVSFINFQRLTEPQVVAIARHPLCGCDY